MLKYFFLLFLILLFKKKKKLFNLLKYYKGGIDCKGIYFW